MTIKKHFMALLIFWAVGFGIYLLSGAITILYTTISIMFFNNALNIYASNRKTAGSIITIVLNTCAAMFMVFPVMANTFLIGEIEYSRIFMFLQWFLFISAPLSNLFLTLVNYDRIEEDAVWNEHYQSVLEYQEEESRK